MPADTCPLCAAPQCDCPREMVDLARQAVAAQGLAIRPLLIRALVQARETAVARVRVAIEEEVNRG